MRREGEREAYASVAKVRAHVYLHVHVCMCMCKCKCMCVCMCVCMYANVLEVIYACNVRPIGCSSLKLTENKWRGSIGAVFASLLFFPACVWMRAREYVLMLSVLHSMCTHM